MGIKFLSLQVIPWCFHMVANTTCLQPEPSTTQTTGDGGGGGGGGKATLSIKLIRTDGRVEVYHRPVSASELMRDHPRHLVCRSDAFIIGQRIPALPAGEQLQPGHAYFLLPVHFFQSVLSFVTLASSFVTIAASNGGGSPASSALLQRPFDVQKTPSGKLQIRVSDEFIEKVKEAQDGGEGGSSGRVCTTAALEKDYRRLVVARHWKPKLETIRESEVGRRRMVAAAAAVALGVIRRRRRAPQGQGGHQNQHQKEQRRRQQQQKQKQMVSAIAHHLISLHHKSIGKKVVAWNL